VEEIAECGLKKGAKWLAQDDLGCEMWDVSILAES
jgi:hypothetical protein